MIMSWLAGRLAPRKAELCRAGLVAGACLALFSSGCTVNTSNDGVIVPVAGRLILDWTIQGQQDPNLCTLGGASAIDIVVTTVGGSFVSEFQAPCAAFSTTISTLAPGSYAGTAELVAGDTPRTTQVPLDPFNVTSTDLILTIDFPANSFF
jgi:hypothetical protein